MFPIDGQGSFLLFIHHGCILARFHEAPSAPSLTLLFRMAVARPRWYILAAAREPGKSGVPIPGVIVDEN